MSSIPQPATFANAAVPIPPGEGISEGIADNGEGISEGISERLASISDRLAVVAVAAHIMQRRVPRDCYARSIARETQALALAVRELHREAQVGAPMRAPRIVDASPDASPDTSPDVTPASPSPTGEPVSSTARRSTHTPRPSRQTPPEARHRATGAQASGCDAHSHARRKGSLAASGGASDGATAEGGAQ